MADDFKNFIGVIVAIIASAATYFFAFKDNRAKELRFATRQAIEAQSARISILETQAEERNLKIERDKILIDSLNNEISRLRIENYNLMQRIWHLENRGQDDISS